MDRWLGYPFKLNCSLKFRWIARHIRRGRFLLREALQLYSATKSSEGTRQLREQNLLLKS
ncbi:MAG: hypothetical protein DME96_08515 [Verrucomicrobia bacterium]|nr:MAG: hypothetical protein DME96_08515 [Verrucomicrobiota bacterium]